MSDTRRLALPLLAAAQAQKHVTHNEALMTLDALSHPLLMSRALSAAPAAADGELYLVANGASGDWAGEGGRIAERRDGAWVFHDPFDGLAVHVADEDVGLLRIGGAWREAGANRLLARGVNGAQSRHLVIEAELSGLSGAFVETAAIIPDRSVVFCVSTRTSEAITGASSYECGLAGDVSKFGGTLGTAAGSSNLGVIGPTAFYSDTPLRLTANGAAFTGGSVRLAVHCFLPGAPDG